MPVEVGIDERNVERGKNQRREAKSEEKDYTYTMGRGRKELTRQKPSRYDSYFSHSQSKNYNKAFKVDYLFGSCDLPS